MIKKEDAPKNTPYSAVILIVVVAVAVYSTDKQGECLGA